MHIKTKIYIYIYKDAILTCFMRKLSIREQTNSNKMFVYLYLIIYLHQFIVMTFFDLLKIIRQR